MNPSSPPHNDSLTVERGMAQPMHARRPTVREIQDAVCAAHNTRPLDMHSQRRARAVARPRQIAMWLARDLTPLSLPAIGRLFGNRDHTTVLHAIRKVEELSTSDPAFEASIFELRQHLLGGEEHADTGAVIATGS